MKSVFAFPWEERHGRFFAKLLTGDELELKEFPANSTEAALKLPWAAWFNGGHAIGFYPTRQEAEFALAEHVKSKLRNRAAVIKSVLLPIEARL